MSQLLGLSFDAPTSPSITLTDWNRTEYNFLPTGWGFAWYPANTLAAVVVKDPLPTGETPMTQVLRDWERFRSTVFICHLRGAAKRITQEDTHPFQRSYAGRDWVMAHSGDLYSDEVRALPLGDQPVFEPVGHTDSERAMCWLLTRIRKRRARRLADLGWSNLYEWLRQLDAIGSFNILLTDGEDLVAYNDEDEAPERTLHYLRRVPPHEENVLRNPYLELNLGDPLDVNRTMLILATTPITEDGWIPMKPRQMLVAKRATVVWDSHYRGDVGSGRAGAPRLVAAAPAAVDAPAPRAVDAAEHAAAPVHTPAIDAERAAMRAPPPPDSGHTAVHAIAPPPAFAEAANGQPQTLRAIRSQPADIAPPVRTVQIEHETIYRYKEPVELSAHVFRLRPVYDSMQWIESFSIELTPPRQLHHYKDVFDNETTRFKLDQPYVELRILARSRVLVHAEPTLTSPARRTLLPLVWMPWQRQMMTPYLLPPELPETQLRELSEFAMSFAERQDFNLVETLLDMNETLYRDFSYVTGSTKLETTPFEVYADRRGVCQDFANLLICLARLLGIPARYRVGYIYTGSDYSNTIQSEASHAWVELYLPEVGWRGFDPTNGCLTSQDHIRVACGRNYRDATPTSGTIFKGGDGERLSVNVRVDIIK